MGQPDYPFGFLFGVIIGGIVLHLADWASSPQNTTELQRKIAELWQRTSDQSETIGRLDREKSEIARQLSAAQDQVTRAKKEVEEAKAAKPDRYKIVKEGTRTWRLDSATGAVCLLLASEADWNDPKLARQGCSVQ